MIEMEVLLVVSSSNLISWMTLVNLLDDEDNFYSLGKHKWMIRSWSVIDWIVRQNVLQLAGCPLVQIQVLVFDHATIGQTCGTWGCRLSWYHWRWHRIVDLVRSQPKSLVWRASGLVLHSLMVSYFLHFCEGAFQSGFLTAEPTAHLSFGEMHSACQITATFLAWILVFREHFFHFVHLITWEPDAAIERILAIRDHWNHACGRIVSLRYGIRTIV